MSTGMATRDEIATAVAAARGAGARELCLLKCTSAYPSPTDELDLRTIPALQRAFDVPVGLSDHTLDEAVAVAAVALGACMIERHLTLARADGGPDGSFSMEPAEFASMVRAVRLTERALGRERLAPSAAERATIGYRRSLFVVADVAAGEEFTTRNVRSVRPADGLAPRHLDAVLGRRARVPAPRGTPLSWELLE
jgi:N-acetylneuraminate synthase